MVHWFQITTLLLCAIAMASSQQLLEPEEFFAGIENGDYDAILDVRTFEAWTAGHIPNSTLVENLASIGTPVDILGCSNCTLAVYCTVGDLAGRAITRLQSVFGFTGTLYNAQGVSQWTEAGYSLTTMESPPPLCANLECNACRGECSSTPPGSSAANVVWSLAWSFASAVIVLLSVSVVFMTGV
jgi:rhodanese-related sulfurtransferase